MRQWYAPGYEVGEDRPLLVFPAAGWIVRIRRQAYAAPGYLVQIPVDREPGLTEDRVAFYVQTPDGQLVRAWAKSIQSLTVDHRGITLQTLEGLLQTNGEQWIDVLRYIDDTGLTVAGYTVSEYQVDMAQAVEEGRVAGPELQDVVAQLEAWRAP